MSALAADLMTWFLKTAYFYQTNSVFSHGVPPSTWIVDSALCLWLIQRRQRGQQLTIELRAMF